MAAPHSTVSRRSVIGLMAGLGLASTPFSRALAVEAERGKLDATAIAQAEWISGITLEPEQREELVRSLGRLQAELEQIRAVEIDADVSPSQHFMNWSDAYQRHTSYRTPQDANQVTTSYVDPRDFPSSDVDIAYAPIRVLAAMLREKEISSLELTRLFLDRLERFGPVLNCVVTLTPELAIRQARRADRDLAAGRDRGPLHGIPWGAKDLIAVDGYPTTWGCERFREQLRAETATVANRLADAGAVLVAKLSLGAIAMGDNWFGGKTLNPWDLSQGSSGSSAGSAAAATAGLVPFALGSETLGSIVSPSRRCGTTGLRPTFGRVSRAGCMPLAWSFDKIGPLCRDVEDAAYVFAAIHGADGRDPTATTHPFAWPYQGKLSELRVGYTGDEDDREELSVLRELGVQLVPISLPDELPVGALTLMLEVESASMFYEAWKDGDEEGLFRWPQTWQTAAFVSGIDYVRASRVRTMVMQQMEMTMRQVDMYVGGNDLVLTNLTGHPTVVMPYRRSVDDRAAEPEETAESESASPAEQAANAAPSQPRSITFSGRLHDETRLLALAAAFQNKKGDHLPRPPQFS